MNNLLERFIKRNNKKRGINITVATIVMFLLSCTGIYAATIIDKNEKENILYVGIDKNGKNAYELGGSVNAIDGDKLIINGRLEAGNNTQSLEISSNAKDVTVENNGFIDGVTIGRDYDSIKTNAKFINNGIITNGGNALVIYSNQANVSNYGIIKASGQNEKTKEYYKGVVLANGGNFNNYGIVIDGDGKISSVGASNQQVTMDNGITYTVKNAVDSSSGTAQAIKMTGTSGSNSFTNYILNGIDTTISVLGKGNNLSGSVVNSLDKAINIESGAELGLGSTTVNGNIAINGGTLTLTDINNKINGNVSGTTDNDIIKLGYQVDSNTNYTNLNTILKGSGVDTLKFSDNGNTIDTTKISFTGKYQGGNGADNFKVSSTNAKSIKVDGGEGNDILTLTGAYVGKTSDFSGVSNVETLQLGNGSNTLDISTINGKFTTIKGGEFVNGGSGKNTIKTSTDIGETLTLVGGKDSSVKNILVLDNSKNKIEFNGKLDTSGGNWNIQVNNLKGTNSVTLNKENLNGKATSLELLTNISGETETKNLVDLLNASRITYAIPLNNNTSNYKDNLVFNGTTLNNKTIFAINYNDSVTMQKNITGQYAFKPLGTFTPTVKVDSFTTFEQNSKVTSVDYNGKESGVNFQVTSGALSLGSLKYENGKLVYSGANPFVDGYKYTINGNVNLNFEGLENASLTSGKSIALGNVNNNITITGGSLSMPSFLKYSNGAFVVKTWSEMNPYGNNNNFLETTYNNMLSNYGKNEAITGALNTWSKDALVNYISTGGITQYDFTLDGKTYQNTLLTGSNSNISKDFKITGSSGSITFQNIATSKGLTLETTGGTVNLTDGVSIGGDINFGDSSNVNLNVNAYYAGGVASTIKNIKGNDNDSNISLTHVNIIGNNSNDGKIELGAGNDTLTLKNVGVNSITGSGKNTLELNQGSNINTIKLGDNTSTLALNSTFNAIEFNNTITVNGGATVKTIDLTESTNGNVTVNSGSASEIKFGTGNNILTYNGGDIKTVDFGSGEGTFYTRADLVGVTIKGDNVKNALVLGDNTRAAKTEGYLTLSGDFSGVSNIIANTDTKFASDMTLRDNTNVNLGVNSLYLGVDYTSGTGEILSGKTLKVDGGSIVLDTTGVKGNATIELGNIEANSNTTFESSSLGHEIKIGEDGKAIVSIKETIVSDSVANDIIKDFIESGEYEDLMGDMTLEEQEQQLDSLVKEVGNLTYNTPYSYSSILSRKTTEMVNNAIIDSDFTIKKNEWVAFGSVLGSNREMKDYYSGVENINQNIDTDIYGAYVQAEYGYTDNMALGFVVGANKTDSDIGQNSLKGTGAYLGGYSRYDYNNIQLVAGFGYQHNSYDADRTITLLNKTMNYSKSYGNDTLTGYMGAKYTYEISQNLTLEPNIKLNLTHTMQDGISEGKADSMAIKVDEEKTTTLTSEIGTDLVKSIVVTEGKVKVKAGISLMQIISGADSDNMNGKLAKTGSKINITTPDQDKTNVKFKVGAQYEKESGVLYNVEGSYITSSKEKEWVVGAGIGYRF